MKVLTIKNPWASLILAGAKPLEVRGWVTHHRGPLGIHVARADDTSPLARAVCAQHPGVAKLPGGHLCGHVELIDCRRMRREDEDAALYPLQIGAYVFVLARPVVWPRFYELRGNIVLWDWPGLPPVPLIEAPPEQQVFALD